MRRGLLRVAAVQFGLSHPLFAEDSAEPDHSIGEKLPRFSANHRAMIRDQAERLWPISAERPIVGKGGPIKAVLRRLMRWYVEPAFADQRAFNDAVLKLIDDLDERLQRLERQ